MRNILFGLLIGLLCLITTSCVQDEFVNSNEVGLNKLGLDQINESEAQPPDHPMAEILNLSEEQISQIKSIKESHLEEHRAVFQLKREGADLPEIREAHQKLRDKIQAEIMSILSDEQTTALLEIKESLNSGIIPDEFLDKKISQISEKLNLSEEQSQDIRPILSESMSKKLSLKKNAESFEELKTGLMSLQEDLKEELSDILTDEQLQIVISRNGKKRRGRGHHKKRSFR